MDKPLNVRVELPVTMAELGSIELRLAPRWSQPDASPDYRQTGFLFESPSVEALKKIDFFVQRFSFEAGSVHEWEEGGSEATTERRRRVRKTAVIQLRVTWPDGTELGRLVNISASGLLLVHEAPIVLGELQRIAIHLPKAMEPSRPVELEARCRWTQPDVADGHLQSGLAFERVPDDAMTQIANYVERFSFESGTIHAYE